MGSKTGNIVIDFVLSASSAVIGLGDIDMTRTNKPDVVSATFAQFYHLRQRTRRATQ
jgi:hypothetical protein